MWMTQSDAYKRSVGAGYLSRRRAAVLVVRVPDLELKFQSIVAEEIPAGMPHGLGWRQLVLVPVLGVPIGQNVANSEVLNSDGECSATDRTHHL